MKKYKVNLYVIDTPPSPHDNSGYYIRSIILLWRPEDKATSDKIASASHNNPHRYCTF